MLLLSESISFTLFEELSELAGIDLISLIVAGVVSIALIVAILLYKKRTPKDQNSDVTMPQKGIDVRALVVGAMCISLAFVLSYMKIFSMPLGGSLTLLSMLPVCLYAGWYGPRYGLLAAFAYGLLQMIQGVWVVHPIQFILDYLLAFTVLGLSGFFKRSLPLGVIDPANVTFFKRHRPQMLILSQQCFCRTQRIRIDIPVYIYGDMCVHCEYITCCFLRCKTYLC